MAITKSTTKKGSLTSTQVEELFATVRELEDSGAYDSAATALGDFWQGVGVRPAGIDSLPKEDKAKILASVGSVSGWIGTKEMSGPAQDAAKDLIAEAIRLFEDAGDKANWAESRSDLAVCYWREGSFGDARAYLQDTLDNASKISPAIRGKIMLRMVNVEISSHQYSKALSLVNKATSLVENFGDSLLMGKLYFHRALINRRLAEEKGKPELLDNAVKDYVQAEEFYQQTGHVSFLANVRNNLGYLRFKMGQYDESQKSFDAALELLTHQRNNGIAGPVYDNKAQSFLAEGKLEEAENAARMSVILLRDGDELSSLAESLTTLGAVQSRLQNFAHASRSFTEAKNTALEAQDTESAGTAVLTHIEEFAGHLDPAEFELLYNEASELLKGSPREKTLRRLKDSARSGVTASPAAVGNWKNFSLPDVVRAYEAEIILRALTETGGRVTKAAQLLGLSHQNLSLILHQRHKDLKKHCVQRKPRSKSKPITQ